MMNSLQAKAATFLAALGTLAFGNQPLASETIYEKTIDGKISRYTPSEVDAFGAPLIHTIDFTQSPVEERTGGAYISGSKPSTSGLCIESKEPIAILKAKQKIELDIYGDESDPSGFETYTYNIASSVGGLTSQTMEVRSFKGSEITWTNDSSNFLISFDFHDNPIISTSTNTFCVPAALIPHTATLVPRSLYTTEAPIAGTRGFVWADQALDKFEWLIDRSVRDNPNLPVLTYPAQSVSYINLKQIELPSWSTNAGTTWIKAEDANMVLSFSDEPLDRTVESSTDLVTWEQSYELPAHETNIVTIPYAPMKFFRVGPLQ